MSDSIIADSWYQIQDEHDLEPVYADDDPKPVIVSTQGDMSVNGQHLRSHAKVAHLVAVECADRFIHVAGLGWHRWDGKRFLVDVEDKAITREVTRVIAKLSPDALLDKELYADLVKSQSASGLAGVVRLMSTSESLTADAEELDADGWLLNTPTGVLNLRELEQGVDWRELTVHPHDPAYRMTQITRGEYDPDAHSELWERFISRSIPDEGVRRYTQQTNGGLGLLGEQLEHLLPIHTGEGRNGKGVFYGALMNALGGYAAVASPNLFNIDRHATADKPNPALLGLRAPRLVFLSETAKSVEMDSAKIKALTGGDRIKARGVHSKTTVEFDPRFQLVLITNHAPQLPADDPAVWERVTNVPWDVVVPREERDTRLGTKLKGAADAILSWALEGLQDYLTNGIVMSSRVAEATEQYKADQDTVTNFITARCEDGCSDRDSESIKILHADYRRYCRANGVMEQYILGEKEFGQRLDVLGYPSKKSGSRRFRQGLRLLPSDEEARIEERRAEGRERVAAMYSDPQPAEPSASDDAPIDAPPAAPEISANRIEALYRQGRDVYANRSDGSESMEEKLARLEFEHAYMKCSADDRQAVRERLKADGIPFPFTS